MAGSVAQVATNSATAATVAATFGSAPSSGNTVLAIINSDSTFTVSGSGTRRFTVVSDQQIDLWEFTGALPTTVTVTPTASDYVSITLLELAGVGAFDVVGTISATGNAVTTVSAPTITTTGTLGDLLVVAALFHGISSPAPASPTYGNSFTAAASTFSGVTSVTAATGQYVGSRVQATAGAVGVTAVSWTNASQNVAAIQISYKAAAIWVPKIRAVGYGAIQRASNF